jgi:hypothetical protein
MSGQLRISKFDELIKSAIDVVVIGVLFLILPSTLSAQQQGESKPLRFDFAPIIGYRTSMNFPIEPHVTGTNPHITLDASPSYGASFGIRPQEDDLVEIRWTRQDSYVHSEDVSLQPPRQRVVLDQFHGDFSHEYIVENWASWARPFVMGSVGATHMSNSTNVSATRFSFGLGGGVRFYIGRHLGFKVQAEWLPIFLDPHVAFICGPGCIVGVGGTISNQGEVLVGPILRF